MQWLIDIEQKHEAGEQQTLANLPTYDAAKTVATNPTPNVQ